MGTGCMANVYRCGPEPLGSRNLADLSLRRATGKGRCLLCWQNLPRLRILRTQQRRCFLCFPAAQDRGGLSAVCVFLPRSGSLLGSENMSTRIETAHSDMISPPRLRILRTLLRRCFLCYTAQDRGGL